MKKNRTTWVLLAGLALLLAAGTLWAFQGPQGMGDDQPGPPRARPEASGGRLGPGGDMMEEMGLTDEQHQQLRALHSEGRKAGIRSHADLEIKRMELQELLEADEPNQAAIDKAVRELNDLRGATLKRHIDHRLAFRNVLSPEQRSKFKKLHHQRGHMFRHHPARRDQRFMDGPGGERRQRRGPGFVRGEGFGGGPDFDLEIEEEMQFEEPEQPF